MKKEYGIQKSRQGINPLPKDEYHKLVRERLKEYIEEENGCWIWQRFISPLGYGRTTYRGKGAMAHRVSWIAFKGDIPKGLLVCHKCDNTKCINPEHLFLGTQSDNIKDAFRKGRKDVKGENCPAAKISEKDVREIFKLRQAGWTQQAIADEYKMNQSSIHFILKRVNWGHITI